MHGHIHRAINFGKQPIGDLVSAGRRRIIAGKAIYPIYFLQTQSRMNKKQRVPKFLQALYAKRQRQSSASTGRIVAFTETSLRDEVENVCQLASQGDGRVIGFGQLVFFSTASRDAWMLDRDDELAICLMKDGVRQPFELAETERRFAIQWQGRYHIEGDFFAYIDNRTPTHARVMDDYPTGVILRTIDRLRSGV